MMNDNDWLMINDWWLRVSAIKCCIFLNVYSSTERRVLSRSDFVSFEVLLYYYRSQQQYSTLQYSRWDVYRCILTASSIHRTSLSSDTSIFQKWSNWKEKIQRTEFLLYQCISRSYTFKFCSVPDKEYCYKNLHYLFIKPLFLC